MISEISEEAIIKAARKNVMVNGSNRRQITEALRPFFIYRVKAQSVVFDLIEEKRVAFAKVFMLENKIFDLDQIIDSLNEFFQTPGQAFDPEQTRRIMEKAQKEIVLNAVN